MQAAFTFGYLPLGVLLYVSGQQDSVIAWQPCVCSHHRFQLSQALSICFVFRSFADSTDNCGSLTGEDHATHD